VSAALVEVSFLHAHLCSAAFDNPAMLRPDVHASCSEPMEPVRVQRPPIAPAPSAARAAQHRRLPTAEDAEAMGIKWDTPRPTRPDDTL